MKAIKTYLYVSFSFLIAALFLFVPSTYGRGVSLGINPPIFQIEANPPASIKAPLTIENLGDATVNLEVELKPFTASEKENGEVKYENLIRGANPLIFQYVQLFDKDRTIKNLVLAPEQAKTLELHIGIPKDEVPSDYYFSVVFLARPEPFGPELRVEGLAEGQNEPNDQKTNLSQTPGGIATNVLLSIGPKGKAQGAIEEFSVPFFIEKGPVPFLLRLKNTSPHVIAPRGQILIHNMFGQAIGKIDLLPVNILSSTTRAIPDSLASPEASASSELTGFRDRLSGPPRAIWPEKFILGPHSATLTLVLSDEGPIFSKTVQFVGAPIYAGLGLLIAIVIVVSIVARVKNRLRKNST